MLRSAPSHPIVTAANLVAVLGITLIIESTGGLPSQLAHLYYLPVVVSALLVPRRLGLVVALCAGVAVSPLADVWHQVFGMSHWFADPNPFNLTSDGWILRPLAFVVINLLTTRFVQEHAQRLVEGEVSAKRGGELQMLARVDRMILGGASESEATMQISRLVAAHMGAVAGAVIVPGTVGNRAEAAYLQRADADEDRSDEEIPNDEGVAAVALRSRQTEVSGNIMTDVRYGERSRTIAQRVGFRSAAAAPILIGGEVIAALFVGFERERDFDSETITALERLAAQAAIAIEHARQRENLEQLARETALALASAIESRDSYTGHHCARLAEYAGDVARELGVERAVVERIRLGAALHDVGKISVPDAVLLKPERLTDDEFAIIQQHCRTGAELCRRISLGDEVLGIVASHHERYDGTGYPDGLAGDAIPLGARIVAVVDAYDAMTTTRPYRTAMPHNRAVEVLRAGAGTQWDPRIVAAFLATIEVMPEHEEHAA